MTLLDGCRVANKPYDWDLVRYSSADLPRQLWQQAIRGAAFFFPGRWRYRWRLVIRLIHAGLASPRRLCRVLVLA